MQFWSFPVPYWHGDLPLGVVRFWSRSSTGHSAGTRPASKPGSRNSKKDQHFLAFIDIPVSEVTLSSFEAQFWSLLSIPLAWGFAAGSGSDFWGRRSTRHSAGARPASKPGSRTKQATPASKTSKQDQHFLAFVCRFTQERCKGTKHCKWLCFGHFWTLKRWYLRNFWLIPVPTPVKRCFALMNAKHWYLRVFQNRRS